jgi:hypothetical protein
MITPLEPPVAETEWSCSEARKVSATNVFDGRADVVGDDVLGLVAELRQVRGLALFDRGDGDGDRAVLLRALHERTTARSPTLRTVPGVVTTCVTHDFLVRSGVDDRPEETVF